MSLLFKYPITAKNFIVQDRHGVKTIGSDVPFTFQGDIQPLNSKEILNLTEGRISSGMIIVFSEIALIISGGDTDSSQKGTYILFEEKWYELVTECSSNTKAAELSSLNHYEYTAEYRELKVD